jgi:hypothetical protein
MMRVFCAVREFEAKREAYYKDQYRSHVGYWQALGDTMRQSGDNTARLTGTCNASLTSHSMLCFVAGGVVVAQCALHTTTVASISCSRTPVTAC